jgi:proteasome lid subunit RPN8/RPN11
LEKSETWIVKHSIMDAITSASKNVFPNEFIGMLAGNKETQIIEELVIVPATFGKSFSSIRLDLLPFDSSMLGSVHSHPSGIIAPSKGDLLAFPRMGFLHMIIGIPFTEQSFRLFNNKGKQLAFTFENE